MPTYKTPDVYVEEVSLFPPSVAEVETAVPAMIGYTEKANFNGKNLKEQAVEITSLVEFEERFGKGPSVVITETALTSENDVDSVSLDDSSEFCLYDSVRMFYNNGGGKCYIISVGFYDESVEQAAFTAGLGILKAEDEPTMILFPDAVLLSDNDLYSLQQAALKQCADLKDRVAILDIRESATGGSALNNLDDDIQSFRDTVGINNLKYGAAYAPHIVSNFDKGLEFKDIKDVMTQDGVGITASELAGDNPSTSLLDALSNYDFLADDAAAFKAALSAAIISVDAGSASKTLEQEYKALELVYKKDKTAANVKNLAIFISKIVDGLADDLTLKYPDLQKELANAITSGYSTSQGELKKFNQTNLSDLIQSDGDLGVSISDTELAEAFPTETTFSVNGAVGVDSEVLLRSNLSYEQGTAGVVSLADSWTLRYTPSAAVEGTDSFTFKLTGSSNVYTVNTVHLDSLTEVSSEILDKSSTFTFTPNGTYVPPANESSLKGALSEAGGDITYTPHNSSYSESFTYSDDDGDKTVYVYVVGSVGEVDYTRAELAVTGANIDITLANPADTTATITSAAVTSQAGNVITVTAPLVAGDVALSYDIIYFNGAPEEYTQSYTVTLEVVETDVAYTEPVKELSSIFSDINTVVSDFETSISGLDEQFEKSLLTQLPVLQSILDETEKKINVIPPSGAMAGVYSYTDETRGVWKAPANISLNSVIDLTAKVDNSFQEDMNVDVTAGKSVNAIRPFSGKGILVWGARTLAGNDNEWRYISVRRFFNMVEESVKKSTYWAVFEPNDANLWVKVKAMIENYLTDKWRDGALAGAKPEDAFYVSVGLGKTMSAQDILEGRLIIDIGMAVVRPAEFIVLRFMHKMQES